MPHHHLAERPPPQSFWAPKYRNALLFPIWVWVQLAAPRVRIPPPILLCETRQSGPRLSAAPRAVTVPDRPRVRSLGLSCSRWASSGVTGHGIAQISNPAKLLSGYLKGILRIIWVTGALLLGFILREPKVLRSPLQPQSNAVCHAERLLILIL